MLTICAIKQKKLRAIARVTPYMTLENKKIVMNSFLIIWMLQVVKIIKS